MTYLPKESDQHMHVHVPITLSYRLPVLQLKLPHIFIQLIDTGSKPQLPW